MTRTLFTRESLVDAPESAVRSLPEMMWRTRNTKRQFCGAKCVALLINCSIWSNCIYIKKLTILRALHRKSTQHIIVLVREPRFGGVLQLPTLRRFEHPNVLRAYCACTCVWHCHFVYGPHTQTQITYKRWERWTAHCTDPTRRCAVDDDNRHHIGSDLSCTQFCRHWTNSLNIVVVVVVAKMLSCLHEL